MKKLILCVLIASALGSCGISKNNTGLHPVASKKYGGGNGLTFKEAIVIKENNEMSGIISEYNWLKIHYPNYRIWHQSLTSYNDKPYDVITILTSDGKMMDIYFNIYNFFGKW
jgi:hypothetical protein